MAEPSVKEFLTNLQKSSLVTLEQMGELRARLGDAASVNSKELAKLLVKTNALTRWQAKQLLAGRSDFSLGKYVLLDELGAGGSGRVYRALNKAYGREVAVKVLEPELLQREDSLARFQREARLAASLNHPNIVTAFDAESIGDLHFLVMEYVAGKDLEQWLRDEGNLPIAWTCECVMQAAKALQYAHEQGLVHRDIKPSNLIVVGKDIKSLPQVKILDMGFARLTTESRESMRLTRPDQTFGTPDYIAPEQAESTRNADIRSDIFSLGCSMFRLLTGELPYPGKTKLQKIMARANRDAVLIRTLREDVPTELEAVINTMLKRLPEERYQTPADVVRAMQPFALSTKRRAAQKVAADHSDDIGLGEEEEAAVSEEQAASWSSINRAFADQTVARAASAAENSSLFSHSSEFSGPTPVAARTGAAPSRRPPEQEEEESWAERSFDMIRHEARQETADENLTGKIRMQLTMAFVIGGLVGVLFGGLVGLATAFGAAYFDVITPEYAYIVVLIGGFLGIVLGGTSYATTVATKVVLDEVHKRSPIPPM